MTTIRILATALFAASSAVTAAAQEAPVTPAAAPTAGTSMPHDCAGPMAKHDHGAEKGMPTPKSTSMSGPCAPAAAVSMPKAKAKLNHDHAKFHKNQ